MVSSSPAVTSGERPELGAGRRADARRNVAAILQAGQRLLAEDPAASVGDIAEAAGLGRVTVYGHFATRGDLVEAVLAHTLAQAQQTLREVPQAQDPVQGLAGLIASSWRLVERLRNVLFAAERDLPPERIREHHDQVSGHYREILEQGRQKGSFRTDLPVDWMIAVLLSTVHTAAEETAAGRLLEQDADHVITSTLLGAFRPLGAEAGT